MATDDPIRDKKLQYDNNSKAAKILVLSSGKIDISEFLTGKKILPYDQSRIIEQTPLCKAFEKQIKTIEDQGIKSKLKL